LKLGTSLQEAINPRQFVIFFLKTFLALEMSICVGFGKTMFWPLPGPLQGLVFQNHSYPNRRPTRHHNFSLKKNKKERLKKTLKKEF
jgi:hypothetical protein